MRRFHVLVVIAAALATQCQADALEDDRIRLGRSDAASGGNGQHVEEARRRATEERRTAVLKAIDEGGWPAVDRLLGDCLHEGSPLRDVVDRRIVERLLDVVRGEEGHGADEPRRQGARAALRTILRCRPEAFRERAWRLEGTWSMHDMFGGDSLPRFVAAATSIPFASEARLLAEGVPDEAPEGRLFRVVRAGALPRRDLGDDGPDLGPHLFTEADLEAVGGRIEWEVVPADDVRGPYRALAATVHPPGPGMYALVQEEDGFRYCQPIEIASFRLVAREVDAEGWPCVVMALDTRTGKGVPGVEVTYLDDGEADTAGAAKGEGVAVSLGRTDGDGVAAFHLPRRSRPLRPALEGLRGGEARCCGLAVSAEDGRFASPRRGGTSRMPTAEGPAVDRCDRVPHLLVTTDEALVVPGGTIRYRAVVRDAVGGMVAPSKEPVRVEIRDGDGRLCHAAEHRWSRFGTLSGVWTVPAVSSPGPYDIEVVGPPLPPAAGRSRWSSTARFDVSRASPPDVGIRAECGVEPGTGRVSIEDAVGRAIADAEVEWSVVGVGPLFLVARLGVVGAPGHGPEGAPWWRGAGPAEPLAPLDDPRAWLCHDRIADAERQRATQPEPQVLPFSFGTTMNPPADRVRLLGTGRGRTGADGTLPVAWQPPDGQTPLALWVEATIRDISGVPAEVRSRLAPCRARLGLEIGTDRLFAIPGEPIEVRVRATSDDGLPATGVPVVIRGLIGGAVNDDGTDGEREFFRAAVTTDDRGRAAVSPRVEVSGRVRWRAEATVGAGGDGGAVGNGMPVVAVADQWSAGEAAVEVAPGWSPDGRSPRGRVATSCAITPDRFAYAAGEPIRLLVRGHPTLEHLFVGIETRTSRRVETFSIERRVGVIEVPVLPEDHGLATVWVVAWNGAGIVTAERTVFIHPAGQALDVAVRTEEVDHEPGGRATVAVEVRDHGGAGRRADVEIGLVDAALGTIVAPPGPHPLVALDPIQSWRGRTTANADESGRPPRRWRGVERRWTTFPPSLGGIDRLALRDFQGDGASGVEDGVTWEDSAWGRLGWNGATVFAAAGAGDSAPAPGSLDDAAEPPQAWGVVTGDDGRARVEIELPERSTRYRVVARAVTREGEAGQGEATLVARRPLELRILAPRSLHVGDRTTVSLVVASDLEAAARVTLGLRVDDAALDERTVEVRPGERRRVDWPLEAGMGATRRIEAEAAWAGGEERVALEIPVRQIESGYRATLIASAGGRGAEVESSVVLPDGIEEGEIELTIDVGAVADEGDLADRLERAVRASTRRREPCRDLVEAVTLLEAVREGGFRGRPLEGVAADVVDRLIRRVSQEQDSGGGWHPSVSHRDEVDPVFVSLVLERLVSARAAGCFVDRRVIDAAVACLADDNADLHSLAVRASAGDGSARHEITAKPLADILDALDGAALSESLPPWRTPGETMALLVLAGREDLLPSLPGAPPGEGAARSVRSLREAVAVLRALRRVAPADERVAELVEWALDGAAGTDDGGVLDDAWMAIVAAHRPPDDRPVRWSLSINGEDVTAGGMGKATVSTGALRPGRNSFRLRNDEGPDFDMAIAFRCRLANRAQEGHGDVATPPAIERRQAASPGTEERFEPLRSGATVSTRDSLRLAWLQDSRGQRLPGMLGAAGVEPRWRPEEAGNLRDIDDPSYRGGRQRDASVRFDERLSWEIIDVRATRPGRYRLPVERPRWHDPGRMGEGLGMVFEEITEPFELVVEE